MTATKKCFIKYSILDTKIVDSTSKIYGTLSANEDYLFVVNRLSISVFLISQVFRFFIVSTTKNLDPSGFKCSLKPTNYHYCRIGSTISYFSNLST